MKKLLACGMMCMTGLAWSQAVDPLIFREKVYDFGEVAEDRGLANHEFVFANQSGRPVKILNVTTSCGCTTPGWTKEPVPSGKTGFVKASFDPRGRPGFFNKSLTILTDLDPNPIVLQIKGTVVKPGEEAELTVAKGNLKLKSGSFSMGTLYINKGPAERQFPVMNSGDTPIKFLSVQKPSYIQVILPEALAPGERGVIKVIYDARAKGTFGFTSDNLLITTTDPAEEAKSISVFATLEEFYPAPTAEELLTAPQAVLKELNIDFGQYPPGATLERNVTLYNRGKKELKIKSLQGNCTCIRAEAGKQTLRAGDSTVVKIVFKPQSRGGTQQKAITLYTNDPRNPAQLVSVSVYVND